MVSTVNYVKAKADVVKLSLWTPSPTALPLVGRPISVLRYRQTQGQVASVPCVMVFVGLCVFRRFIGGPRLMMCLGTADLVNVKV